MVYDDISDINDAENPHLTDAEWIKQQQQKNRRWSQSLAKKQQKITNKKHGRNDPCACGSGKKFKFCCWKPKVK